ncbi:orotate phosphoribosyltransferase [Saprospiraceae bacterium]|jgi:orotate phosphoribosyltransferase|nr:orotate phosphoribosyltransferase [Bacteroidota bacterium]MDB4727798.1 orotate phosphoribosyltransferase [Saprospiraceae bacterium]MDF1867467.1 orotate phosphoribosyltransferase [Saprospiraceae bacterium]
MSIASEVARHLLQIKAIRLNPQNPFTWASGIKSPIYCDNRMILSYPTTRNFIKEKLAEKSKDFDTFDVVAGVATAGIAHGMLLADALNVPFIYVRDKAKGHGRQNQIEGDLKPNSRVLVVEDLISTGGSSLKAVDVLKEAGGEVIGVLAIFTYGFEKADQAFSNANCPLKTLSNYDALIPEAIENQYISDSDLNFLKSWRTEVGSSK